MATRIIQVEKKWRNTPEELERQGLPTGWFDVTLGDCLDRTERAGYWKRGTVKKMLADGLVVSTPFADFRMKVSE